MTPGATEVPCAVAGVGGGLAPHPPRPCRQLPPSRAEEQRGGWGWGGGFRAGQAREPGPAPAAAPTPAPFLPACLGLPARACPPSARGCRRPGLAQSAPSPPLPVPSSLGTAGLPSSPLPSCHQLGPDSPPLLAHRALGAPRWPLALGSGAQPGLGGRATSGPLLQPLGSSRSRGALGWRMAGPQGLEGQGQRAVAMPTAEHACPWPWAESGAVSASYICRAPEASSPHDGQ